HGLRRRLAVPIARLVLRAAQLVTRDQTTFNLSVVASLRALSSAVTGHVAAAEQHVAGVREEVGRLAESVIATGHAIETIAQELRRETAERVDTLRAVAHELVAASRAEAAAGLAGLTSAVRAEAVRTDRLRTELLLQERRIGLLLDEARRIAPDARERIEAAATREVKHFEDRLYVAFEDHFRGTREDIKERARHYVPIVRAAGAGSPERPILDLGCGRGEWLEVLAEEGLCGRG